MSSVKRSHFTPALVSHAASQTQRQAALAVGRECEAVNPEKEMEMKEEMTTMRLDTPTRVSGQAYERGRLAYTARAASKAVCSVWSDGLVEPAELDEHTATLAVARLSPAAVASFKAGSGPPPDPFALYQRIHAAVTTCHATSRKNLPLVVSLFIMATYGYKAAETVPYLHILGGVGTGKTRLAELLEMLCFNGRLAAGITSAATHRLIEASRATLLLDEQSHGSETWSRILRVGYRRSGRVTYLDRNHHLIESSVYGPKVIFSNDEISDEAIRSRTIKLITERAPQNALSRLPSGEEAQALRDGLHLFALTSIGEVSDALAYPTHGLTNRDGDLATLLHAVARQVDCAAAGRLHLAEDLRLFFEAVIKRRECDERIDGPASRLARAVLEFLSTNPRPAMTELDCRWFLSSQVFQWLKTSSELPARFVRVEHLGRALETAGLLSARKIVDVTEAALLNHTELQGRVQRTAYLLNEQRAKELAA
jgi:hypothetical protein